MWWQALLRLMGDQALECLLLLLHPGVSYLLNVSDGHELAPV
jgi:hypothetical protein